MRDEFRASLMAETLDNALKLPVYAQAVTPSPAGVRLTDFPLTDKAWIADMGWSMTDPGQTVAAITCTSATSGDISFRVVTTAERAYREKFFDDVAAAQHDDVAAAQHTGPAPREVQLLVGRRPGDGPSVVRSGSELAVQVHLDHESGRRQTAAFLTQDYSRLGMCPRVGRIVLTPTNLVTLTAYLLASGVQPCELGVREIVLSGEQASSAIELWAVSLWEGTRLFDRYGLSEIFGGATRSARCGAFHTDIHVHPEFLRSDGTAAQPGEMATLVLTELYPFTQAQPLIRYSTGDLVRRVECECGLTDSFHYLSRRSRAVLNQTRDDVVLNDGIARNTWADLVLHELADICRPELANAAVVVTPDNDSPEQAGVVVRTMLPAPFDLQAAFIAALSRLPVIHTSVAFEIREYIDNDRWPQTPTKS